MNYSVRLAENKDKEGILNLLNSVFSANQRTSYIRDDSFYKWKYENNPFGEAIITVAESRDRIVGVDNLWPWEFELGGTVYKAIQPCDSVVHPDFRRQGVFMAMRSNGLSVVEKKDFRFLFNFPNKNSLPLNLSLGSHYLGKIPWLVKILKPVSVLKGMLTHETSQPCEVEKQYLIDYPAIDKLSGRYPVNGGVVGINRIKDFHFWRFNKPGRNYGMITYDQERESASVIFTLNTKVNVKEMIIVDVIGSSLVIKQAIRKLVIEAGKMNVAFVSIMSNPLFKSGDLIRMGFIPMKKKNMVVKFLNSNYDNTVFENFKYWSLVAAMHDSI
jgi:hypothetical protein